MTVLLNVINNLKRTDCNNGVVLIAAKRHKCVVLEQLIRTKIGQLLEIRQ